MTSKPYEEDTEDDIKKVFHQVAQDDGDFITV